MILEKKKKMENYDDLYTGRKRGVFNVRLLSHVIINGISELYCLYCFFFFFSFFLTVWLIFCVMCFTDLQKIATKKKKNKIVGKNNRNENSNQGPIQPIVFH